jgi:hypothetical protein
MCKPYIHVRGWMYKYPHSYARHKMVQRDQLHVLSASSPVAIENKARFAPHSVTKLRKREGSVAAA